MHCEPTKEHQWLQKFVGEWTYESEGPPSPDQPPGQPPSKFTGTESVRSIGGIWIQGEGRGQMPGGGEAIMVLTIGYNPATKRYVGTWIGSMMTMLWVYDGELDAAGRILTQDGQVQGCRRVQER
jgi:hypothetical protein